MKRMRSLIVIFVLMALSGCASQTIQRKDGGSSSRPFALSHLAKGEVDMVAEIHQRELLRSLRALTEKLYRRNPQEYRKVGLDSVEAASERIFEQINRWPDAPLATLNWEDSFRVAFLDGYAGDRVHAFMGALTSMLMAAYNHKTSFYLPDTLSSQKLYNSARNIEVAVWKLSTAKTAEGGRFLLSNSLDGDVVNLSFEREFGKLIAMQDMLALIMEDKGNRSISRVFQSFVFLPI
jgi:hypothetical protein